MLLFYRMKIILLYIFLLFTSLSYGQDLLRGKVINEEDYESIHIFNKTHSKYTITDANGKFEIAAEQNDTIVISALQYELKEIIVTPEILKTFQQVFLEAKINELAAVFIKPTLSGNLLQDVKNIKTKEMVTAKTLGLPNADVVPPTQEERQLYTATHSGGIIPVSTLINAISGRTKELKKTLKLARKSILEDQVIYDFSSIMQNEFKIPEAKLYDFLYYASEDELFTQVVKTQSNMVIYDFLKTKAKSYRKLQVQK